MRHPLRSYYAVSITIHLVLFIVTGFFVIMPKSYAAPIRVSLIDSRFAIENELIEGRIEDIEMPAVEEKPDENTSILSKWDNKADSPEPGKKYKAGKTALPKETLSLPSPVKKKSEKDKPATLPKKPVARLASLVDPENKRDMQNSATIHSPFSEQTIDIKEKQNKYEKFQKDDEVKKEKRKHLSALMTDNPQNNSKDIAQEQGLPEVKTNDIEKYVMTDTGDVIDMGDEAVVSLSSKSFKYFDYFKTIKLSVEGIWTYPEDAVIRGLSGRAMIKFTINSKGELLNLELLKTSGHKSLDDEAQAAVKLAAPYKAFPARLNKKRLHIVATFIYQPTFNAVR